MVLERRVENLRAAATIRADHLRTGLRDGVETVVEEFAEQILRTLQLPDGIELDPKAAYRRDRFEPVVDIRLPDLNMLPTEKSGELRTCAPVHYHEGSLTDRASGRRAANAVHPDLALFEVVPLRPSRRAWTRARTGVQDEYAQVDVGIPVTASASTVQAERYPTSCSARRLVAATPQDQPPSVISSVDAVARWRPLMAARSSPTQAGS